MELQVNGELRQICREILAANKTEEEWAEIESDDMFQSGSFVGGFDADERAFCFSYYDAGRDEYWFQLTLDEAREVAAGELQTVSARRAEK